ncbi:MAG: rRNA maturation RNase YbeY [Allosphingosinicella sp.]
MIQVESDGSGEWDSSTDWPGLARRAVLAAVEGSRHAALAEAPLLLEVSVRFASDAEVRALNAAWRGKDQATNVLSFPMVEPASLDRLADSESGEALLGDIVLAHGICAGEAEAKGVEIADHAAHLIVHGMLHLLGYDHEQGDVEAERMETVEQRALASMGIADPYVSEVRS